MENLTEAAKKALAYDAQLVQVREVTSLMFANFDKEVRECVASGLKIFPSDFYVLVLRFVNPHDDCKNVLHNKLRACRGCPTPTWSQDVFKYIRSSDDLKLLWSIPTMEACQQYQHNKSRVHPSEYDLLKYVLDYHSGALDLVCKKENELAAKLLENHRGKHG